MTPSVPSPDGENCSIAAALGVLGEKWTLLVLREAFSGIRRFEDMLQRTGAPRQVLSARLARLVDEGILRRVPYRETGQRQRAEYRLTDKGLDLYPILVALMHWGDRWANPTAVPPVILHHRGCDAEVALRLRCGAGHDLAGAREVRPRPGDARDAADPLPERGDVRRLPAGL